MEIRFVLPSSSVSLYSRCFSSDLKVIYLSTHSFEERVVVGVIYDCECGLSRINMQRGFERCYILTSGGRIIGSADGTADEIYIPMPFNYYGATFTHNHTNNFPLSLTDVHLGCYHYMGAFRAVTDDKIYSIRNPGGTLSFEIWEKLRPHVNFFIEEHGGGVSPGDYDSFWRGVAVKYDLEYQIIPIGDSYGKSYR